LTETMRLTFRTQLPLRYTLQFRTLKLTETWIQLGTDDLSDTEVMFSILQG